MWVLFFLLDFVAALAFNSSISGFEAANAGNQSSLGSNETELSLTPWPQIPFTTRIIGTNSEDYGNIKITNLDQGRAQHYTDKFSLFVNDVTDYYKLYGNDRLSASGIDIATGAREQVEVLYFELLFFAQRNAPRDYLGQLFSAIRTMFSRHGFRDMEADLRTPFGEGDWQLRTDNGQQPGYIPPFFISTLESYSSFIVVTKFMSKMMYDSGFVEHMEEVIYALGNLDQNAPLQAMNLEYESIETEGLNFTFKLKPQTDLEEVSPLSNGEARKVLRGLISYWNKSADDGHPMEMIDFDIVTRDLYGAEVVAKAEFWWEPWDEDLFAMANSTIPGPNSTIPVASPNSTIDRAEGIGHYNGEVTEITRKRPLSP